MNDVRIAELARMAVELDELERDVAPTSQDVGDEPAPMLRLVGHEGAARSERAASRRRASVIAGITAGLGAAACLGVAMTAAFVAMGPAKPKGPMIAQAPGANGASGVGGAGVRGPEGGPVRSNVEVASALPSHAGSICDGGSDEQCCMVVAMVRDAGGVLRCVKWRQHEWDVQRVSGMSAMDLKGAVPQPCGVPTQVVLVAMTGPTKSLPRTDEGAERLASCIMSGPRGCETDGMCFNGAAARCLPNDVSVKVETVAWPGNGQMR